MSLQPKNKKSAGLARYVLFGTCMLGFVMLFNSWNVMDSAKGVTALRTKPIIAAAKTPIKVLKREPEAEGPVLNRPLPKIYPNGVLNQYNCDPATMNMEYLCGMKQGGCSGYPQMFNMGDISDNWIPDNPDIPDEYYNSLCRFNMSNRAEKALAFEFRKYEVPFIVYGVPELEKTHQKWTDDFLATSFADQKHKVQISENNHFMFYRKTSKHDPPPTYTDARWSYTDFVEKLKKNLQVTAKQQHFYFFVSHHNQDLEEEKEFDFIKEDLPILDQKANPPAPYDNFFLHELKEAKGIHCRFGMRGIVAEGHYDAGLNMVAMIRGAKRYILSPPSACDCQYLLKSGPSARHTQVDWSNIDTKEFPLARGCQATEAIVGAGDILYIPSYWFHHIVSLDQSVQCNARSGIIYDKSTDFLKECDII